MGLYQLWFLIELLCHTADTDAAVLLLRIVASDISHSKDRISPSIVLSKKGGIKRCIYKESNYRVHMELKELL